MKLIFSIILLISVIDFIIYAAPSPEPGIIRFPLTKRQSAYHKRQASNNSVALTDFQDGVYFLPVKIGGQTFQVDFDTGSLDLWVPGISCTTSACTSHKRFDSSKSSTFRSTNKNFTIQYVDGDAAVTTIGYDTVSVGNATATNQVFGFATAITATTPNPFDGVMGFGPGKNGQLGNVTFFHQLVSQGAVKAPIFSVYLGNQDDPPDSQGEVTLGGIDFSKIKSSIVNNTLIPGAVTWDIFLDDLLIDGTSFGFSNRVATIDTGTSYIVIPEADLTTLSNSVNGNILTLSEGKFIQIPCDFSHTISLKFSGVAYSMNNNDVVLQAQKDVCVLGMFSISKSIPSQPWIVGDAFLRNVYSVFNITGPSVGFAKTKTQTGTDSIPIITIGSTTTTPTATVVPSLPKSSSPLGPMLSGLVLKIIAVINICVILLHL